MKKFAARLLLLILVGIAVPLNATVLTNGDFETGTRSRWTAEGNMRIAHINDFIGPFLQTQGMDGCDVFLGSNKGSRPLRGPKPQDGRKPRRYRRGWIVD